MTLGPNWRSQPPPTHPCPLPLCGKLAELKSTSCRRVAARILDLLGWPKARQLSQDGQTQVEEERCQGQKSPS